MQDFDLSLVMITYEQEGFVRDAVRSLLAQDCAPAEILISDDCSPDRTFEILQEECAAYTGPHRVSLSRNETNRGSGNLMLTAARAKGRHTVMFHGDDLSEPHRARRLLEVFRETGAELISSNGYIIDETGQRQGLLQEGEPSGWVKPEQVISGFTRRHLGATQAWTRGLFAEFPAWTPEQFWGSSDLHLPFRAGLLGGAYYLAEPLMSWRQHSRNLSKEVQDRTRTPDIANETSAAHAIAIRLRMQEDLQAFRDRHPERTDLEPAAQRLRDDLDRRLRNWAQLRSRLHNGGYRKVWVTRAELLAREGHSQLHQKPKKSAPRTFSGRLRNRLARDLRRLADALS